MQNTLIERVQEICLSATPNLIALQNQLESELQQSPEETMKLIYQTVLRLNASNFYPIKKLEIMHTEGCNLACTYCFEKNMNTHNMIKPEIARAAVDLLFDYSGKQKELSILHFGGEPTLNFSSIKLVTEYAKAKASLTGKTIRFSMTSNGTLIDEEMAKYFAQHRIMVLLSIDGMSSSHNRFRRNKMGNGSFDQTMKGVEILKKTQRWIGTKMTVMPENVQNLYDDVVGLYSLGINQFIIDSASGVNWSQEDMDTYVEQLKRLYQWFKETPRKDLKISQFELKPKKKGYFGCEAGRNKIAVSVKGEISPCSKILGLNNQQPLAKLGDVWYGLYHLENRADLINCYQLKSSCEEKGIAADFQGGCFASNYNENKDLFEPCLQDYRFKKIKMEALCGN